MITQTFYKTFLRGIIAILTFSIVFGANIALAQNTYVPPAGPPESFNAPAPFHEGQAGQAKWWQLNLPNYTIGALYGAFEGVVSKWTSADDGVAATKFCLMDPSDVEGGGSATGTSFYTALDYFPSNIQGGIDQGLLNCIDWESGWGESILTSLGTGEPGNPNKPPAEDGQFPWWNSDFAEFGPEFAWSLSDGVRLLQGNILAFVQASLRIGTGSTFEFVNNAGCPEGSWDSVMRAKQKIHPTPALQSLYIGHYSVGCSTALKLKDIMGTEDTTEEVIVKSIPTLTEIPLEGFDGVFGTFNMAKPRPLCYASENFTITQEGKGMLVDCASVNHGSVSLFGPKFTWYAGGNYSGTSVNNANKNATLESQATYDGLTGTLVTESSGYWGQDFSYLKYEWEVPFGVTSATIKGCGGGGGGGGGGAGFPSGGTDKPGGGGGGGGGAGKCTPSNGQVVDLTGVSKLVIKVGAGGRGGNRGEYNASNYVPEYLMSSSNPAYGTNGRDGAPLVVEKHNDNNVNIGTVVDLGIGFGGDGGRFRNQGCTSPTDYPFSGCQNAGGAGGRGGDTPNNDTNQLFIGHNGTTGRDNESNFIENIFAALGYWTEFADNISAGGNGGYGRTVAIATPNIDTYDTSSNGNGGNGATANGSSQGNVRNLMGRNAKAGKWSSGGGGGGGASGWDWGDTCAFPADPSYSLPSGSMSDSADCQGDNQGATSSGYWFSRGGLGGHGGPGFVTISW